MQIIRCQQCQSSNPEDSRFCAHCGTNLNQPEKTLAHYIKEPRVPFRELTIGSLFAGKYRIVEKIGAGGMGVVYKAEDTKLKRHIALKFLSPELTRNLRARERFIQEAQAASVLDHPNICTIHEIEETDEHQMYIAMAYYTGKTLKQTIEQKTLSEKEALDIIIQTTEGMMRAHVNKIMHRDIKPANLIITDEGVVKIVDFGLAKLASLIDQTQTVEMMGTVAYMSPEQIHQKNIDFWTDIWSLGVVLYQMMTTCLPFKGKSEAAFIHSILNKSPVPPTDIRKDISREMERVILRCLRKKPEERYKSSRHLLSDLIRLRRNLEEGEVTIPEKKQEVRKEIERRQATVISAEISGYAEMLERLGEEEVASVMSRFFGILGFLEEKYGGHIERTTANSFMVFFGIPTAIEDAPKKAVNAAIELRNRLYQLNHREDLHIPSDIRMGINTGMVIAGAMGTENQQDYSVMGETVTFSSELKDIAADGQTFVGPITYKYTKDKFDYREVKSIPLKSQKESVSLFELLSVKEKIYRAQLGSERMIESEIIGRDKELDRLEYHLLKTIMGEGSIVSIIGEAGIGKSRLIAEFKRKEAIRKVKLLEGGALSIGRNFSFHPIIDIIKSWAGIKEEDSAAESAIKLEKAVRNVYPDGVAEVFPFIATLMGMKLKGAHAERVKEIEGEALETLILKNLREFIVKAAEQIPLVFVIEDLHWADQTSIEFLEAFYRLVEDNPILFINVFRPNYTDTSERLLSTIKDRYSELHSEIVLGALDEHQSDIMINNLLKIQALPPNISGLIKKRTEGNPFFIEEVARSFIDDGVVEIKDGRFKVTEKIDSVVIPETIDEVLMARVDKLDKETRTLLKVASVIGRSFFYKILVDVATVVKELDEKLDYLKDVQLIKEQRRLDELEYLFKHALAQQAVYDSILRKARNKLHYRVAKSIELVFQERLNEFYGMLAFHYSKGEDLDKAEEYLIKAGEEALKSAASSEALHYYQEALNIYLNKYGDAVAPKKVALLEKNIALTLNNRGQYGEANKYLEKVLEFYGVKNPHNILLVILKFVGAFSQFLISLYFPSLKWKKIPTQKDKEILTLSYIKCKALSNTYPKKSFVEFMYLLKRFIHFDLTKLDNGLEILSSISAAFSWGSISFKLSRKTLGFAQNKAEGAEIKSILTLQFSALMLNLFSGNWNDVEEYKDELVNLNLKKGEIYFSACYVSFHTNLIIEQGNFIFIEKMLSKLSEIGRNYENSFANSVKYRLRTLFLMKFRKLPDALAEAEKGIEFVGKTGFRAINFSIYSLKTRILLLMGNMEDAEKSLVYLDKIKSDINLATVYISYFLLSKFVFAIICLQKSLKDDNKSKTSRLGKKVLKIGKKSIKNSQKIAYERTEIYRLMGTCYWIINKQKKALRWWKKSIKEGEYLGAKLELSRAYMEVGKRLSEKSSKFNDLNGISASQYLIKASVMFKEMDLQWDLDELEKIEISSKQLLE